MPDLIFPFMIKHNINQMLNTGALIRFVLKKKFLLNVCGKCHKIQSDVTLISDSNDVYFQIKFDGGCESVLQYFSS